MALRAKVHFLFALAACGDSPNPYLPLFEPTVGGSTTSTIHGTWGVEVQTLQVRWVLAPDRVTIANKCGNRVVGIDVSAEVTPTMIGILEAADSGDSDCFVRTAVGGLTMCTTDPYIQCFLLMGTSLTTYENAFNFTTFTKLSDSTDY